MGFPPPQVPLLSFFLLNMLPRAHLKGILTLSLTGRVTLQRTHTHLSEKSPGLTVSERALPAGTWSQRPLGVASVKSEDSRSVLTVWYRQQSLCGFENGDGHYQNE